MKLLALLLASRALAAITLAGSALALLHAWTNAAEAQADAPEAPSQLAIYATTRAELNCITRAEQAGSPRRR